MSQDKLVVGSVFRALRKKSGLTQEAVAFRSGFDRTYISMIELGQSSPTIETTCVLLRTMKVSFTQFAKLLELELSKIKENESSPDEKAP